HLEGVRAVGEAAVGVRAGAGREAGAVELALEVSDPGTVWVGAREVEAGRARVARVARLARDRGVGRGRVDEPAEAGRATLVAGRVLGLDVEAVRALDDRVGLRARAGVEAAAVELAEEAGAALAVGEAEAGVGRVGRVAGVRVDRGRGWRARVEHVVARRLGAGVVGRVGLLDVEGVGAVGLAGQVVALRARAGGEGGDGGRAAGE